MQMYQTEVLLYLQKIGIKEKEINSKKAQLAKEYRGGYANLFVEIAGNPNIITSSKLAKLLNISDVGVYEAIFSINRRTGVGISYHNFHNYILPIRCACCKNNASYPYSDNYMQTVKEIFKQELSLCYYMLDWKRDFAQIYPHARLYEIASLFNNHLSCYFVTEKQMQSFMSSHSSSSYLFEHIWYKLKSPHKENVSDFNELFYTFLYPFIQKPTSTSVASYLPLQMRITEKTHTPIQTETPSKLPHDINNQPSGEKPTHPAKARTEKEVSLIRKDDANEKKDLTEWLLGKEIVNDMKNTQYSNTNKKNEILNQARYVLDEKMDEEAMRNLIGDKSYEGILQGQEIDTSHLYKTQQSLLKQHCTSLVAQYISNIKSILNNVKIANGITNSLIKGFDKEHLIKIMNDLNPSDKNVAKVDAFLSWHHIDVLSVNEWEDIIIPYQVDDSSKEINKFQAEINYSHLAIQALINIAYCYDTNANMLQDQQIKNSFIEQMKS